MAKLIVIDESIEKEGVSDTKYCEELEMGNILFFPKIPFSVLQQDIDFLLNQRQKDAVKHKNIACRPRLDKITNFWEKTSEEVERFHRIMKDYFNSVIQFLSSLLYPYTSAWDPYYSFPLQGKGREETEREMIIFILTLSHPDPCMVLGFFDFSLISIRSKAGGGSHLTCSKN